MRRTDNVYHVFWDEWTGMFGIEHRGGEKAPKVSTDFDEADRLAQLCLRCEVSPVHFLEVIEDYKRA